MLCDLAAWRLSRGGVRTHKHLDTAGLIFGFNCQKKLGEKTLRLRCVTLRVNWRVGRAICYTAHRRFSDPAAAAALP
jgi:hypothetical protein